MFIEWSAMFLFFIAVSAQTLAYRVEYAPKPPDISNVVSRRARRRRYSTYQLVVVCVVVLCIVWCREAYDVEHAAGLPHQALSFGLDVPAAGRQGCR